jgi:hypothetical protein
MAGARREYSPASTIDDLIVGSIKITNAVTEGWLFDQLAAIDVSIADIAAYDATIVTDITDLKADKLDAIIDGETIIIGGYLNTSFIEAGSIVATKLVLTDINALSLLNGPAEADADATAAHAAAEILNLPATPVGQGLFCTTDYLGYYDAGVWKSYISATGDALFGSVADDNFFYWDGSTVKITTNDAAGLIIAAGGGITIQSGGGMSLEGGGDLLLDGGQIKNAADPTATGGVIIDPDFIRGYTSAGLRTFEVNFSSGVAGGDFYAGDYNSGNEGLSYDHGTGKCLFRGELIVTGGNVPTGTDITDAIAALGDLASEDLLELTKLGTTIVSAGYLQTVLVNADLITAGTLDADVVDVVNLNADNITTGTLDASLITVGNINASVITAGTIDVDRITGLGPAQLIANAVSVTAVFNESSFVPLTTAYATQHSESITLTVSGSIFVSAFIAKIVSDGDYVVENAYVRLVIAGTVVAEAKISSTPYRGTTEQTSNVTLCGGLAVAAGTHTVAVQVKSDLAGYAYEVANITGFAQGIVR